MTKHKIFLEKLPAKDANDFAVDAGYFGPPEGQHVSMNHYIYARTSVDRAWEYPADEAFRIVGEMLAKGYLARCEPPVSVTR